MIHVNWRFFEDVYDAPNVSLSWTFMACLNIITRFSVPCFVMISGAFILAKESNGRAADFWKRSSYKVILPAVIATVAMTGIRIVMNQFTGENLLNGLIGIPLGNFYNLWYICMLTGLYILTPVIIDIRSRVTFSQYCVIGICMLIWGIISQATSHYKISYSSGVIISFAGYYIIGDILYQMIERKNLKRNKRAIMTCIILIACSIYTAYIWRELGHNYYISNAYINFFSPAIVVLSLSTFVLFGVIDININCLIVAKKTYFVYLFHSIVLGVCVKLISRIATIRNTIISEFILYFFTVIGAYIIAYIFDIFWNAVMNKHLKSKWDNMIIWKKLE